MSYSIQRHESGYGLTFNEAILAGLTLSGAPYAKRHKELSEREEYSEYRIGHRVLMIIQYLPGIGLLTALIERIAVYIASKFESNENQVKSSMLDQTPNSSGNNKQQLDLSAQSSIDPKVYTPTSNSSGNNKQQLDLSAQPSIDPKVYTPTSNSSGNNKQQLDLSAQPLIGPNVYTPKKLDKQKLIAEANKPWVTKIEVNTLEDFNAIIEKKEGTVILFFKSNFDESIEELKNFPVIVEKAINSRPGATTFAIVDKTKEGLKSILDSWNVNTACFLNVILENGREVKRIVGPLNEDSLKPHLICAFNEGTFLK
jgi:hypothetical protein